MAAYSQTDVLKCRLSAAMIVSTKDSAPQGGQIFHICRMSLVAEMLQSAAEQWHKALMRNELRYPGRMPASLKVLREGSLLTSLPGAVLRRK